MMMRDGSNRLLKLIELAKMPVAPLCILLYIGDLGVFFYTFLLIMRRLFYIVLLLVSFNKQIELFTSPFQLGTTKFYEIFILNLLGIGKGFCLLEHIQISALHMQSIYIYIVREFITFCWKLLSGWGFGN